MPRIVDDIETGSSTVVTRGCGKGGLGSWCSMRIEFQSGMVKKILEMENGDGCTM